MNTQKKFLFCGAVASLLMPSVSFAADSYNLFNPVPDDKLRAMTTERPSKTDSPFSLDAGRIQIETNLFAHTKNNDCIGGTCTKTKHDYVGGATNLRIGLTDDADIQIISDLYHHVKTDTSGTEDSREGFGDTQVRLKLNILGNDPSSKFSLGFIPYAKIPTNQDDLGNNEVEGGIGLPFNINFDGGWILGGMTQLNYITEPDFSGYDPAYANSLIVGKSFTDKLGGYAEIYTYKADQDGAKWLNTADFGVVYSVTDSFKIDANAHFGVSDAADDMNLFLGTAYRF
jgi:hypothetical protein